MTKANMLHTVPMQVRLVYYNLVTPGQRPAIAWGWPGSAKTAVIEQIGKWLGWEYFHRTFSEDLPEDLGGQPMYVHREGGGVMVKHPQAWVRAIQDATAAGKRVLLFCDEVTNTPTTLHPALMALFHDLRLGEERLDRNLVKVVGASNPVDLAGYGQELSAALSNRAQHVEWPPMPADLFVEYLLTGRSIVSDLEPFDPEAWADKLVLAKSHVAAFINARPASKDEDPRTADGREHGQYASSRTWDFATLGLATCYAFGDTEAVYPMLRGFLGEPVALAFQTYVRDLDLPDPEVFLAGEASYAPDNERGDRTYAALQAIAAHATFKRPPKEFATRWVNAFRYGIGPAVDEHKGASTVAARTLGAARPSSLNIPVDVQKIIAKISPVVREAGLV